MGSNPISTSFNPSYILLECVEKLSNAARKRLARLAARVFVDAILAFSKCEDCSETNPVVLEFHHVVYPKVSSISRMISNGTSTETIQKEVDKCVVLCSNCHRIRHHEIRKKLKEGIVSYSTS